MIKFYREAFIAEAIYREAFIGEAIYRRSHLSRSIYRRSHLSRSIYREAFIAEGIYQYKKNMSTFESEIKSIRANDTEVFAILSDLRNAEKLKERIPQDKVKNIELAEDSISFEVVPIGALSLKIVEREPNKTIKFSADHAPVDFFVWLQLKQIAEDDTKLKVTLKADLNPMIKMMASKPLEQFVNTLADSLAKLDYKK